MSIFSTEYQPIHTVRSERLSIRTKALPKVLPVEKLGVNVSRIESLMAFSGIRHLDVIFENEESSAAVPQIVSISRNGEATAGAAKANEVKISRISENVLNRLNSPQPLRFLDGNIEINTTEIQRRILQSESEKVTSPESWAKHINVALQDGIVDFGERNLCYDVGKAYWLGLISTLSLSASFIPDLINSLPQGTGCPFLLRHAYSGLFNFCNDR